MDLKQKESESKEYSGYQSYGEQPSAEMVEKTIKRDMMLLEYDVDRDVILGAIQNALKERNYDEAQEFVFQYRAAAKTDEKFAVLAQMTADGVKNKKEVDRIQVVLDATPEDDYEVRLSLSERMYKLIPDEANLDQINRYRKALGKPLIEKKLADADAKSPAKVGRNVRSAANVLSKVVAVIGIFWCCIFIALILGVFSGGALAIVPAAEGCVHGYSLVKAKKRELSAKEAIKSVLLNTGLLVAVATILFVCLIARFLG